jgi:hypothetical protein
VRHIIGQRTSAVSFRVMIDQGQLFLANLAKGRLGEDVSSLLGSLLVNQLELAALNRADVPAPERRNFFLYVDEAHLIATQTMVELFPEARMLHLGLVLAHQYLDQRDEAFCALGEGRDRGRVSRRRARRGRPEPGICP